MRKLSSKELTNGIFVQFIDSGLNPVIYQVLIKDGKYFYRVKDSDWEIDGELVKNNWYETELTKSLNREEKLIELGI